MRKPFTVRNEFEVNGQTYTALWFGERGEWELCGIEEFENTHDEASPEILDAALETMPD